jgi:hypothetical protein
MMRAVRRLAFDLLASGAACTFVLRSGGAS